MGQCASHEGLLLESFSERSERSCSREVELVPIPEARAIAESLGSPMVLSRRILKQQSYTHFPDISMHDIDLDHLASETPKCDSQSLAHPLPAMLSVGNGFVVGVLFTLPQQTLGWLNSLTSTPSENTQD